MSHVIINQQKPVITNREVKEKYKATIAVPFGESRCLLACEEWKSYTAHPETFNGISIYEVGDIALLVSYSPEGFDTYGDYHASVELTEKYNEIASELRRWFNASPELLHTVVEEFVAEVLNEAENGKER